MINPDCVDCVATHGECDGCGWEREIGDLLVVTIPALVVTGCAEYQLDWGTE